MKYSRYNEKLQKLCSAVIMDAMDTLNVRVQCMAPQIKPLAPTMRT